MLCGRRDRGVVVAWRQGQDCSLTGGAAGRAVFRAGVVGGRFCGDLGREDGEEYVRGSRADGGERRSCCEGGLCERRCGGQGLWWRKI